ncbi:MAG TPA: hypothetical protein PKZ76_02605 [Xanthomonadaceae bacterium]|nr:hypothetical protein [Xanthomonadaceae bacterium]
MPSLVSSLACASLFLAAADVHAAEPDAAPAARYAVRAQFEVHPPAQANARFALRADLEPRRSHGPVEGLGIAFSATLTPKSGPICFGPGHAFANGFEAGEP